MDNQQFQQTNSSTEPIKKGGIKFGLSIAIVIICLVATGVAVYWIKTEPVEQAESNINIPSTSKFIEPPNVEKLDTPEKVLSKISSDLRNCDKDAVLKNLEPTEKNKEFISPLNCDDMSDFAKWFENAKLKTDNNSYKVYITEFTDNKGQKQTVEFIILQNIAGGWIIGGL